PKRFCSSSCRARAWKAADEAERRGELAAVWLERCRRIQAGEVQVVGTGTFCSDGLLERFRLVEVATGEIEWEGFPGTV
ncbi:MAG: hypothetical protein M0Z69_04050, partial [Actinomycetota bacterium]|nr:hypothetical protein [Actinomycetota bacterium]